MGDFKEDLAEKQSKNVNIISIERGKNKVHI